MVTKYKLYLFNKTVQKENNILIIYEDYFKEK